MRKWTGNGHVVQYEQQPQKGAGNGTSLRLCFFSLYELYFDGRTLGTDAKVD